jgi:NitT/TauT family transport system substrate-binding protein
MPSCSFRARRSGATLVLFLFLATSTYRLHAETIADDGPRADLPLTQVRIALQWIPQSQFAGFYVAREQGFYAAAGADVSLLHPNARESSLELLTTGKAELATSFLADAMMVVATAEQSDDLAADANSPGDPQARNPKARPVLLGQLMLRSNLMLLGWRDRGIHELEDLDGKHISFWPGPFSAAIRALLKTHNVVPEVLPQYGSVNLFLRGGVHACAAMEYNEFHRIWQAGVDEDRLRIFLLRDLGFDLPEDGLYARADWLKNNRALARRLWRATMEGWRYARAHPEQAIDLVLAETERAHLPANRPHERWMLDHLLRSIFIDGIGLSAAERLSPRVYAATAQALLEADLIEAAPPLERFCPDCRLEDVTP